MKSVICRILVHVAEQPAKRTITYMVGNNPTTETLQTFQWVQIKYNLFTSFMGWGRTKGEFWGTGNCWERILRKEAYSLKSYTKKIEENIFLKLLSFSILDYYYSVNPQSARSFAGNAIKSRLRSLVAIRLGSDRKTVHPTFYYYTIFSFSYSIFQTIL